jgi:DNA-binding MarR family transcriptional regulator
MPDSDHSLDTIVGKRQSFLESLEKNSKDKCELETDLDISRSTVDRGIRELSNAGLVTSTNSDYQLTLAGRTALTAAQQYHRRLQEIDSGRDLLSTLPSGTDIADVFLDGASYAQASPEIPDRIIRYLFDSIESADVFRGVSPVALAGYLDEFYAVTTANGTIVKHVVDEDVVETLLAAPELRSGFIKQAQHDRVSLLSGDISFNYGLWIVDDIEAGIVFYTDTGVRGIIINDSDAAIQWAHNQWESVMADATSIHQSTPQVANSEISGDSRMENTVSSTEDIDVDSNLETNSNTETTDEIGAQTEQTAESDSAFPREDQTTQADTETSEFQDNSES